MKTRLIFACARRLAKQPVFIISTMIQKLDVSELVFNSRSVFAVAVSTILEGERDYDEQALATPMFQILCFLRGVANMVLVYFKNAMCEKCVFSNRQKSCLYMHQKPICAQPKKNSISLFCDGQDRIPEQ